MNITDQRRAMSVAATHTAKQAVELVESIARIGEHLDGDLRARRETETTWARGNIAAIRRELDDLEELIEGREPKVPVAPRAA